VAVDKVQTYWHWYAYVAVAFVVGITRTCINTGASVYVDIDAWALAHTCLINIPLLLFLLIAFLFTLLSADLATE
jgi:hypothetical protein